MTLLNSFVASWSNKHNKDITDFPSASTFLSLDFWASAPGSLPNWPLLILQGFIPRALTSFCFSALFSKNLICSVVVKLQRDFFHQTWFSRCCIMASKLPAKDVIASRALADAAQVSRLPSPTSAIVPDLLNKAFSLGTFWIKLLGQTVPLMDLTVQGVKLRLSFNLF